MTWTKSKMVAAGTTVLLLSGTVAGFVAHKMALRSAYPADSGTPFKFAKHGSAGGTDNAASAKLDPSGLADFNSSIPILVFRTKWPGPVSTSKSFSSFALDIYEPKDNEPARLDHAPTVTTPAGLHVRGMVSRLFPKRSYRVRLQDEAGQKHGRPLLGMPSDADWVLHGPWLDKSLIRNAFSYDLARAMGCAAMRTRPCEVFLNTSGRPVTVADYIGVYQLIEDVERGKHRVNVAKLAPENDSEPAISGGYVLDWDVGDGTYLPHWKTIQVKYPSPPSRPQLEWIDRAFTQFDQALKGKDFRNPEKGYAAHIEVDDWVNYILFEEFIFNLDGYTRSFYLQKDRGGKIRPGPVWDHDLALGHQFQRGTSFTQWWHTQAGSHGWVTRLMDDPAFARKLAERWALLRKKLLSDAQIQARIDAAAAPLLSGAADRNFERWRILNIERPFPRPNDYITIKSSTYPEQIAALKEFLRKRAAWMDATLSRISG